MRRAMVCVVLLAGVLPWPGVAWGQEGGEVERFERAMREAERDYLLLSNPTMTLGERVRVDYGATLSFNFFAIDDRDQETHILRQTDAMFYGNLSIDGVHEFHGRVRYTYLDFNAGDDFDGLGDTYVYPIADRWWYKFDLARDIETSSGERPDYNFTVKAGRQFVEWGSGLVYSDDLYAVRPAVEAFGFELEGLFGTTPESTVIDFDSSRNDFDEETDRRFIGGLLAYEGFVNHRPYLFALHQSDHNDNDVENIALPGGTVVPTGFEYDSTYFGVGSKGNLHPKVSYAAEFIYEIGEGLSNSLSPVPPAAPVTQTEEDVSAWAGKMELGYHFHDASRTRLDFETILASGDDDRQFDTSNTFGGNLSDTDDEAFNAFGYARTGVAFAAPVSNLMLFRVGASTYPSLGAKRSRNLRLGVDFFVFNKFDADAPVDEATSDDRYLGFETDVYATWRVTSDVAMNVRYGVFFPGEAIEADSDERHFLFTGISYSF